MSEDEGGSQDTRRIDLADLGFFRCLTVSAAMISLNPVAFSPGKPAWLIGLANWASLKGFRRSCAVPCTRQSTICAGHTGGAATRPAPGTATGSGGENDTAPDRGSRASSRLCINHVTAGNTCPFKGVSRAAAAGTYPVCTWPLLAGTQPAPIR